MKIFLPIQVFTCLAFITGCLGYHSHLALLGEAPYIASIWMLKESFLSSWNHTEFQCTGTLISNTHVLTTITCLEQAKHGLASIVSVGHVSREDYSSLQYHVIEHVTRHDDYEDDTKEHDLAILTINPGVKNVANAEPIKLRGNTLYAGSRCTVVGWRQNFFFTSDDLRLKEVHIHDDDILRREGRVNYDDWDQTLRAGDPEDQGQKECNVGDEGGPLVCDGVLTGLFSSRSPLCFHFSPQPTLYHHVAHYTAWITEHARGAVVSNSGARSTVTMATVAIVALVAVLGNVKFI